MFHSRDLVSNSVLSGTHDKKYSKFWEKISFYSLVLKRKKKKKKKELGTLTPKLLKGTAI